MTWREFQLKLEGYKREQKNKWYHTRFIGYQIYRSIPLAKGSNHVSIEKYMDLGDEPNSKLNNVQRELLKEHMKIAIQQAKEKANG